MDSTRRGKRIPDSLSKTIPIWCAVINMAIENYRKKEKSDRDGSSSRSQEQHKDNFDDLINNEIVWDTEFHSLPSVISQSEHDQIAELVPKFTEKLLARITRISF